MKWLPIITLCILVTMTPRLRAQDFLDRVEEKLTFSLCQDRIRARFSGLVDIEGYYFSQPAPGLIDTSGNFLVNPRLTLFLDTQIGSHVYFFAQSRLDRGFDPSDGGAQVRLDEYALRLTPWQDGRFNLQVGKFATVVGNWRDRHLSWDNPFINAPLPYENTTSINDSEAPYSRRYFLRQPIGSKYEYAPLIWGPSYATGASIAGRIGRFDYAAEIKNTSLSSPPESWAITDTGFDYPTFSGRVGFRPDLMWNLGFSASSGPYFRPNAASSLPKGQSIGDYHEQLLGQDIGFAWRHWQLWAEVYEARFQVPRVGNADTIAYYLETKYKFSPQFFCALRWNQQAFGTVSDGHGGRAQWDRDVWQIDTAVGYRLTAHTQLKLQYSLQHQNSAQSDLGHTVAAQFTLRF